MQLRSVCSYLILPVVVLSTACSGEELPGHYFTVEVDGIQDDCNDPDVTYVETFEYRVLVQGNSASVYLDESLLGTGSLVGCELSYRSSIFTENREDSTVRWALQGDALISLGGGSCDAGSGWLGEERIDIFASDDPDIDRGCTYFMEVTGTYQGEVE